MHFSIILQSFLAGLALSTPAVLQKRVDCTDQHAQSVPCSCTCPSGWGFTPSTPVEQGQYVGCSEDGTSYEYSPVGFLQYQDVSTLLCNGNCHYFQPEDPLLSPAATPGCYCCSTTDPTA